MDIGQWFLNTLIILGGGAVVLCLLGAAAHGVNKMIQYRHEFWLAGLLLCRYRKSDRETIDRCYAMAIEELEKRESEQEGQTHE